MPMWLDGPDGTPYRPRGGVWTSLETGLVNVKVGEANAADVAVAVAALVELGLKFAQTRPTAIQVTDQALGEQIVHALGDPELVVTVVPRLDAVSTLIDRMAAETDGEAPPAALEGKGVTVERMRAFAVAARDFYAAAPWGLLSDTDLIHVEAPSVAKAFRHLTVLGGAGHTFGLGFFSSSRAFDRMMEAPDPTTLLGSSGAWSVTFDEPSNIPLSDHDLWEEQGFPVAVPEAYPVAACYGPSGGIRRPSARELGDIEAVLLALSGTTEVEIDRGRWTREVATHDGLRRVTLAIPDLLRPIDDPPEHMLNRGGMERALAEVERFAASHEFASQAELNEALQATFQGPLDAIASTARTPLERAQDLAYRAMDERGRRRIQLARKALEVSADCADAYVILAEECADDDRARDLYAQGVAAGERALGADVFAQEHWPFWGEVRSRPYMRARFGLARCLEDLDRRDEAITHYRELLRLNPNDNQGVRYSLLPALLLAGRDDEAGLLLQQFDDPSALWQYGATLWAFRRDGNGPAAREQLRAAVRSNRHVPGYFTSDTEWDGFTPPSYAMGSRDEAAVCVDELGDAWATTPGALEWLAAQTSPDKHRKRRR